MKKYIKHFLSALYIGLVLNGFFFASSALAGIKDKSILDSIASKAGVTGGNVESIVGTVIKAVLSITGLIFLILMVYAGILWMTARGEESNIEKARDIIQAALIGLGVTVSAYAITVFVTSQFK